jgi:hypothetical protein
MTKKTAENVPRKRYNFYSQLQATPVDGVNTSSRRHPPASQNPIAYLSYQLGGGSLERRAVKVEIIIAEFHHINAPTP